LVPPVSTTNTFIADSFRIGTAALAREVLANRRPESRGQFGTGASSYAFRVRC
jgi:hypothetical protein